MNAKILIVEDEAGLATTLKDRLQKEGHTVSVARDGNSGMDLATREPFDLLILDLMLPGQNGLTICQKLRQLGSNEPILMLTARRQTMDKVVGLRTGADDYLTKPFKMVELLARVDALLRRAGSGKTTGPVRYQFGDLQIDTRSTELTREGATGGPFRQGISVAKIFCGTSRSDAFPRRIAQGSVGLRGPANHSDGRCARCLAEAKDRKRP